MASAAISPLAPKSFPEMPEVEGIRFATGAAGIRYKDRTDVMLVLMDEGTQAAGVFTKSKCPSAPVDWCRAKLKKGRARALVGQFRQCQCIYRQTRGRLGALRRKAGGAGDRRARKRNFPGLDRCHR